MQNRTCRTRQSEQDRQNRKGRKETNIIFVIGRTGQADRNRKTGRAKLVR
jgi:hypothetical protein